jgi:hypothetical protein
MDHALRQLGSAYVKLLNEQRDSPAGRRARLAQEVKGNLLVGGFLVGCMALVLGPTLAVVLPWPWNLLFLIPVAAFGLLRVLPALASVIAAAMPGRGPRRAQEIMDDREYGDQPDSH